MAIGFPRGPGKRSKEWSWGGSVEQLSSLREAIMGARAQPRHLGMAALVTAGRPR